jgi:thiamine biosynthesis lipoprotein
LQLEIIAVGTNMSTITALRIARHALTARRGVPFALGALISLASFQAPLARFEYRKLAMGVEARIVLYAESEEKARDAATAAFARIEQLEMVMSDYREDSEVSRLCAKDSGDAVPISEDLYQVLERALAIRNLSGSEYVPAGTFDVTVGPLTRLWRDARKSGKQPEAEALAKARARVGNEIHTKDDQGFVTPRIDLFDNPVRSVSLSPETQLDFGAIGKGFACDKAMKELRDRGVSRAMIEIGGDLFVGEAPPNEKGWRIANGCDPFNQALELENVGVASSGDNEQFVEIDGVRYSHIIDPRTGMPLTDQQCVTIVAPDATTADALATAVRVIGKKNSRELLTQFPKAWIAEGAQAKVLFDGKSLGGWVTRGGHYDGDAAWSVEDGCITGRQGPNGEGGLLYTAKPYSNFELELDAKLDYPFDSGIFVRMAPEGKGAQITLDYRPDGEVGAIYSDGFLKHNETGKFAFKAKEWNHFEVRCTGFDMHIVARMNGNPLCDYELPEASPGYAPRGLIGVQVHGDRDDPRENKAQFREIRLRELQVFEDLFEHDGSGHVVATKEARAAGWKPLLERDGFAQWEPVETLDGYVVKDGVLSIPSKGGGYLRTKENFRDFRLRFDFKLARMANSGLFLRGARDGTNPAYSGCEVQMLDDFNWEAVTKTVLKDTQFTGSLYGSTAPGIKGVMHPIGEWNTFEVLYRGSRLAVALNGLTLYDVDTLKVPGEPPFEKRAPEGFIGLQRYGAPDVEGDTAAWVRDVWVQRL